MTEEIDTQALGAEGDRCSLCRAPLAIDQRYCLQCGQRRGARRVDFGELLPLEESSPAAPAATNGAAPAAPPPGGSGQAGPWTPLAIVASVATLGLMLLVGVMIGKNDDPTTVAAAPAAAPAVASTDTATGADTGGTGGTDSGAGGGGKGGGDTKTASDKGGKKGGDKSVPASQAPGAQQLDEGDLEALEDATGQDAADASNNLPDTIATPGEPPPTDNQAPGAGSDAQVIK